MRAWEFIREAGPTNSGTSDGNPPKLATPATAAPKPIASTGTQPKPLNVTASAKDPNNPKSTTPTAPSAPTLGAPTPPSVEQDQDQPNQQQQATQQTQQQATQQQDQMTKNLQGLAQKMGMDNQQTQLFTQKLMGTGSQAGGADVKQISPADMQKAMPKPGTNLNVKGLGQAKVLPTPGDEKGVKVDTTNKLGYPVLIDPRDLQQ